MSGLVRVTREGGHLRIALDRPDARNALSSGLLAELTEAFRVAADDDTARVVILAGEGQDFCAGADLTDMRSLGSATADECAERRRCFTRGTGKARSARNFRNARQGPCLH